MADDDDDDTPRKKSSKGPKKRFGERDDSDDEDDRPRKKKRPADDDGEEDDKPRSKRKADEDADADEDEKPRKKRKADAEDEDADDDQPRKKRRAGGGTKPVQGNERIPLVMLLAFIGSAVALLGICAGCGFLSYTWIFPDKDGGGGGGGWGGGGGNEFEVVSASRTQRPFETTITWAVKTKQTPASTGYYYVVSQGTGNNRAETQIMGMAKGEDRSGSHRITGTSGPVDVWVEYRTTPVGTGKKVSNTFNVR